MLKGFFANRKGQLLYYTIPAFEQTGMVRHCFTTSRGGVSTGECDSLNLGFNRKDTRENVLKNYQLICSAIGINPDNLVFSNQVHDNRVRVVTKEDCGKGILRESDIKGIDALVCNQSGVPLITFYADCVPVYLLDTKNKAISLVHSGWRSTVQNITEQTILTMKQEFGTNPQDLLAAIGPSIGRCHFEVDLPVAQQFEKEYIFDSGKDDGKYFVDLWQVVSDQLKNAGVPHEQITLAELCTYCNSDIFFSNRAHKGKMGSLAAIMELI